MVDPARIFRMNDIERGAGCVIYWMQRDQRADDNWALLYAQERALAMGQPLVVLFCLVPNYLGATRRHYSFMLKGLQEVESRLSAFNIPFSLLNGSPDLVVPGFVNQIDAGLLVTDFNPLRMAMHWKKRVNDEITIPFIEVDAHNILPCRAISDKLEYAAFTIRKKVEKSLSLYLTDFPGLVRHGPNEKSPYVTKITGNSKSQPVSDWNEINKTINSNDPVAEVDWIMPGPEAASLGLKNFLDNRLDGYCTERNFPDKAGQSDLSPWLHFGHISAQRVALAVQKSNRNPESKKAFLEELIVRRELADNFCFHNHDYDLFEGFQPWAKKTLDKHRDDPREYLYNVEQFELGLTHDDLWNAAQFEMVHAGKMHGFMRMYWAKKILEWTHSPEEAVAVAVYLNDKYELDGRDPNGYAGIAWAIGGVHDRPWGERKVFGMIRFMNYQGCKRKFDVEQYIRNVIRDAGRKTGTRDGNSGRGT